MRKLLSPSFRTGPFNYPQDGGVLLCPSVTEQRRTSTRSGKQLVLQLSQNGDMCVFSHKYRSTLADTRQELGHAKHVKEHLQSFLDATLVGEQWKGTLRSNDVHLWMKHECLQGQLNIKLKEVRLKLKNLPLQKMIVEKPKRSRDRNKTSRLSDRIVGRNAKASPPEALDPLRFCQEKILRFFDEEDTASMFYRDTQSLAESSPRRISMAKDDFLPFLRTLLRCFYRN